MKRCFALLALIFFSQAAYSVETFGTVDALSGTAYTTDQTGKISNISFGQQIFEGQTITTAQDSELHVTTEDGGFVALRPNTTFRVDEYKAEGSAADKIIMSLLKGSLRSITGWIGKYNTQAYHLNTPTATIGVRGTDHETTVIEESDEDEAGTYDTVNEGRTVLQNAQGSTEVTPGKHAFAPKGRVVPPSILSKRPNFWLKRKLKIEDRIEQRKVLLHARLESHRKAKIEAIKARHPDPDNSLKGRREKRKEKIQEHKEKVEHNREKSERRQD
jgi:hypothetical protein